MPAWSAATSGDSAGVRSSIDPLVRVEEPAGDGADLAVVEEGRGIRASEPKLAASWFGLPSGSQRPVPVVSSTPSKPAIDIVFRARSWSSRGGRSRRTGACTD